MYKYLEEMRNLLGDVHPNIFDRIIVTAKILNVPMYEYLKLLFRKHKKLNFEERGICFNLKNIYNLLYIYIITIKSFKIFILSIFYCMRIYVNVIIVILSANQ